MTSADIGQRYVVKRILWAWMTILRISSLKRNRRTAKACLLWGTRARRSVAGCRCATQARLAILVCVSAFTWLTDVYSYAPVSSSTDNDTSGSYTRLDHPAIGCQITQVTQGANCPIRSSPPITWPLSDWHFPFPDPGFWV